MSQKLLARLARREEQLLARIQKARDLIERGLVDGEEDRTWLERFCVGQGLDVCCGDYVMGEAEGVDLSPLSVGASRVAIGPNLTFADPGTYDFIICNYFDAFESPIATLNEWHRAIKPGGTIAFICCNAETYTNPKGPLSNRNRNALYTPITVRQYLHRCGFKDIHTETVRQFIRASAVK